MSETAHTLEPLKTCMVAKSLNGNCGSGIAVRAIMTANNIVVAELTQNTMPEYADLFAAAPDMLYALKECAEYLGSLPPGGTREPLYLAYSAAVDAIAKSEGR